ncbi:MAG: anthranilate synthase component I family protein [Sphingomonadales bacterium]
MFESPLFKKLSFEDFKGLAKTSPNVAVYREIFGDSLTPIGAFNALGVEAEGATLLESSEMDRLGRFSFLHINPYFEFRSKKGEVTIFEEGQERTSLKTPIEELRACQKIEKVAFLHDLTHYTGGLIGFVGYDSVRHFEDIPDRHDVSDDIPDIMFRRYRDTIVFDHQNGKVVVASLAKKGKTLKASYDAAMSRIGHISELLLKKEELRGEEEKDKFLLELGQIDTVKALEKESHLIEEELSDDEFKALVVKAKSYIRRGDVFQVVLSRSFKRACSVDPFDVYRALRLVSPSPYMFYIDAGDYVVTGASPEKQTSLEGESIEICPLAGTRPRGSRPDSEIEADLLGDQKECAEHIMLVDLARNDLGRVSLAGSVNVDELMQVQKFSHVMHLSSTVSSTREPGQDTFDILTASFPAGTLSGAPKIRAMEIIDELEQSRRGVYGGAVCSIDGEGNLNSCIAIRTAVICNGVATVRAGAGIVADSDPTMEAQETKHKAQSVMDALALAERGV